MLRVNPDGELRTPATVAFYGVEQLERRGALRFGLTLDLFPGLHRYERSSRQQRYTRNKRAIDLAALDDHIFLVRAEGSRQSPIAI